jgi:hypothetical protein
MLLYNNVSVRVKYRIFIILFIANYHYFLASL